MGQPAPERHKVIEGGTRIELIEPRRDSRAGLRRFALPAPFLSQLIADHHGQPARRTVPPPAEVLRPYDAGGQLRIRRMPPGYRMNVEA